MIHIDDFAGIFALKFARTFSFKGEKSRIVTIIYKVIFRQKQK
jgi:hypothetical protein